MSNLLKNLHLLRLAWEERAYIRSMLEAREQSRETSAKLAQAMQKHMPQVVRDNDSVRKEAVKRYLSNAKENSDSAAQHPWKRYLAKAGLE